MSNTANDDRIHGELDRIGLIAFHEGWGGYSYLTARDLVRHGDLGDLTEKQIKAGLERLAKADRAHRIVLRMSGEGRRGTRQSFKQAQYAAK